MNTLSLRRHLMLPAALLAAVLSFGDPTRAQQAAQIAPQRQVVAPNARIQPGDLSAQAMAQITELEQEKKSRLPAQRKLDSNLWYTVKMSEGLAITKSVPILHTDITPDADGLILVDITADVSDELLGVIKSAGGVIVNIVPQYRAIRAQLPLRQMEYIAGQPGVQFIKPAVIGQTQGDPTAMFQSRGSKFLLAPFLLPGAASGFGQRADAVRAQLPALMHKLNPMFTPDTGSVDSEGDTTHRAITARSTYGVDGTGISIGVMSDSDDFLENSQATGDLPANVTVLPGQSGVPGTGEGTAMMEIVHDIAPGAKIFFATGSGTGSSQAQMAANIVALQKAGCQIIVDDIGYADESPFQDSPIAEAVETVTAAGAYYFSSATNNGNGDSAAAISHAPGCWEGPFVNSGIYVGDGVAHQWAVVDGFIPVTRNGVIDLGGSQTGQNINLFWNDPLGKSTNDYDLYELDSSGSRIVAASTNPQNGTQDPYENITGVPTGNQLAIVLAGSGVAKQLHMDCSTQYGYFNYGTAGRTRGHNSVNAVGAYGVAATPAAAAQQGGPTGPYPNAFDTSDVVENFSSDGPREQFFDKNGAAVSGGFLFLSKPDFTAADGVTTSLSKSVTNGESFSPFFGTSAAAPHAAAIAGLLLSYAPTLTQAQVRSILTGHTIDIMASGWDRDSGYGILDAVNILSAAPKPPAALASLSLAPTSVTGGQANATGTVTLTTNATAAITVTLASGSTAALTVPTVVTIAAGAKSATFTATSKAVTAAATVTVTATYGSVSKTGTVTVNPAAALSSLTASPTSVIGGQANSTGTVTLSAAAAAATTITLASSNTAAITVPASVTVAAGAKTATFTATSKAVTTAATVTLTATLGSTSKAVNVAVTVAPPTIASVTLSPTAVIGGQANATGTVTLSAAATAATYVGLTSSNTAALTLPTVVTIAAGAKTGTFTATSKAVTAAATVTVTATLKGVSKTAVITVNPKTAGTVALSSVTASPTSVVGGQANSTGTVTLSANATATTTVTLTSSNTAAVTVPTSIAIAAGQNSALFVITSKAVTAAATVTVTATYGGVSKTCTVTVNPPAGTVALSSVTASPTSVVGGKTNPTGTVTLTANTTATTTVTLKSSSTAVTVPASVAIAAGQNSALFVITSKAVTATTSVTITATLGSVSKTCTVTVTPATTGVSSLSFSPTSVQGGSANTIGTVTMAANVTAATTVTLTSSNTAALTVPSSVAVAAGQNSAIFQATSKAVTATTNVTVTATAGGVSKTAIVTVTP